MRHPSLTSALVCLIAATAATGQELEVARAAARIDTMIDWITDGHAASDPDRSPGRLGSGGVDRGKLLDEALARAAAGKKLVLWYIPRIQGMQMYRPALLDDYMRVTAFSDRLLASLITARFVPLRMAVDGPITDRMGIKATDWVEPAIAVLDANGKIVHRLDRIRTFNVDYFRAILIATLAKHADVAPVPDPVRALVDAAAEDPAQAFEASLAAIAAGYDEGAMRIAEAVIAKAPADRLKAHGHFLAAAVHRLARNAEACTHALDRAEALAGDDAELKAIILTERGLLALRTGDTQAAQTLFADAAGMAENPRRPEALYRLAVTRTLRRGFNAAERDFRRLVSEFPDSPYAPLAAANLLVSRDTTPLGPVVHAFEDPFWPPAEASARPGPNTSITRGPGETDDAARAAIAFLLRRQHEDGGFKDSRYAYWDSPRILPNAWVAISAVALSGLLDWRHVAPEQIDDALKRGEKYLFKPGSSAPGQNEECYADTFRLFYLKRRLASLPADSKEAAVARERLNAIAKALVAQQSETGFFAHEYPNPFATGAALVALRQARDLGAAVPAEAFALGAQGLLKTRGATGAFTYSETSRPGKEADAVKNAMARMPLCEYAIMLSKDEPDSTALSAAIDNFWTHLPRLERVRTCDFHTDGELGGFFFWHGMYFTSEAMKALPSPARAESRRRMIEHVMKIGEMDGSFIDSHELGKSYGTGMALMVLRNCVEEGP